jgi:hypothetical protein
MTMHRFTLPFSPENFLPRTNNMTIVPHPTYFSLFPQLKMKLKDHHFDTIEVTDPELQAVMSILTEHDFQDAFKKLK